MANPFIPRDTSPEAHRVYCKAHKDLGIEGRAKLWFELNLRYRRTLEAGVRLRHPNYDDDQVRLARIRLQLGDKLFQEVYPGVEVEP